MAGAAEAATGSGGAGILLPPPDIMSMDDVEVARRFPEYDGRWSEQTKRLVREFEASGLDLNLNWADRPVDWYCKACGRAKPDIVRKTEVGVLLAHLHLHHDHLRDHLGALLNARFGIPWARNVPMPSRLADEHMRALVERFWDTLVCDACNTADGTAKVALGPEVHAHFSFAPSEIARFVRPRPNVLHEVNVDAARRIWAEARAGFEDRLAFADALVERLAAGLLDVERGPDSVKFHRSDPADTMRGADGDLDPATSAYLSWRTRAWQSLSDRSVSRDGVGKPGRARGTRPARRPTDAELSAFEDRAQSGWRKTPGDWRCPCCGRDKRGVMRVGKSGGWFGQIRVHYGSDLETDIESLRFRAALYPRHRAVPVVGRLRSDFVCSDCGDVASDLQRSRPDLGRPVLSLDDIRSCLGEVRDNERTAFDLDAAAARSEANAGLARAEREFGEHEALSRSLWDLYEKHGAGSGSRSVLVARSGKANVDVEATPGALNWLLRQGRRFRHGREPDGRDAY